MEASRNRAHALREQIAATERELQTLKEELVSVEEHSNEQSDSKKSKWPLSPEEYLRYGRQMIVPSIGMEGEHATSLRKSRD